MPEFNRGVLDELVQGRARRRGPLALGWCDHQQPASPPMADASSNDAAPDTASRIVEGFSTL
jgi:hypothetical protein